MGQNTLSDLAGKVNKSQMNILGHNLIAKKKGCGLGILAVNYGY